MKGVDKSDQLLAKYNLLRKCIRWWKTLFFHMVDMAVVNGFILFQAHSARYKTIDSLKRPIVILFLNTVKPLSGN